MSRDPRIDAYIARSAAFAQPILEELRERVHAACPNVEESIKWGMPAYLHAGAILCSMAAFKQHASFGYWKHALVVGEGEPRQGMGSYGKFSVPADLPAKRVMAAHIRRAMKLNEEGVKSPSRRTPGKPAADVPADLAAALRGNGAARKAFEGFPPSAKRDYIEWITEAKREETRRRRLAQAIEWMAEGKRRNWKYEAC